MKDKSIIELLGEVGKALDSCVTLSNGWEQSFDEDKVMKATTTLTEVMERLDSEYVCVAGGDIDISSIPLPDYKEAKYQAMNKLIATIKGEASE